MLMYNLLEYSDKYSMTSGRLWNYYRDEINDDANENANSRINKNKKITSKYFHYKQKLTGSTPNDSNILDTEIVVVLNYLSNFWRSLDLVLINCEIEIDLKLTENCLLIEKDDHITHVSFAIRQVGRCISP